jgi:hypothetical protein
MDPFLTLIFRYKKSHDFVDNPYVCIKNFDSTFFPYCFTSIGCYGLMNQYLILFLLLIRENVHENMSLLTQILMWRVVKKLIVKTTLRILNAQIKVLLLPSLFL